MTEEEFETLRSWGESLTEGARPEVRAAGRAIQLLVAEIERLQLELWHAQLRLTSVTPIEPEPAADPVEPATAADSEPELDHQLRSRLSLAGRLTRRLQPERLRRGDL